jgi:hypothetical protein
MMRLCLGLLVAFAGLVSAATAPETVTLSGRLIVAPGKPTTIQTADHQAIQVDGDDPTRKVLGDQRLNGFQVQAKGHFTAPGHFLIDPMHTRALLVRKDGSLKMITYWCDVCSIRAYTPGPCVCCQQETTLDLRDPDKL